MSATATVTVDVVATGAMDAEAGSVVEAAIAAVANVLEQALACNGSRRPC